MDPVRSKVKVTLQIPYRTLAAFDEVAKGQLGLGRNAFFTMGAVFLLVKMAVIFSPKKRTTLLKDLADDFQQVLEKAAKTA